MRTKHSYRNWSAAAVLLTALLCGSALASELISATQNQDLALVQSLLADNVDPNATQPDGATALHWAVFHNNPDLVTALLDAGADPDAVNRLGASALYIAAKSGNSDLIAQLLAAGADPNVTMPMGEAPVMTAAHAGSAEGVRQLIAAGADVNARESSRYQTALMWAAAQGHEDVARALVAAGADLEARSKVRPMLMYVDATNGGAFDQGVMENLGGYTPLLFAARNGHVNLARLLLESGADVNGLAGNGASPLVIAIHSGHTELAELLLQNNADPDAIGAGYNALHAAVLRGDLQSVRALLARGADANVRLQKATPVQRASEDWAFKTPDVSGTPYWLAASFREP
ncbi:MAG: ankyrin repeat domain-containing protein, partial [Gammaproteobacteria bacterium]